MPAISDEPTTELDALVKPAFAAVMVTVESAQRRDQ